MYKEFNACPIELMDRSAAHRKIFCAVSSIKNNYTSNANVTLVHLQLCKYSSKCHLCSNLQFEKTNIAQFFQKTLFQWNKWDILEWLNPHSWQSWFLNNQKWRKQTSIPKSLLKASQGIVEAPYRSIKRECDSQKTLMDADRQWKGTKTIVLHFNEGLPSVCHGFWRQRATRIEMKMRKRTWREKKRCVRACRERERAIVWKGRGLLEGSRAG